MSANQFKLKIKLITLHLTQLYLGVILEVVNRHHLAYRLRQLVHNICHHNYLHHMGDSKPKQHRARPTPFRDNRILRKLAVPSRLNHGTSTTSITSNASSRPSGYG